MNNFESMITVASLALQSVEVKYPNFWMHVPQSAPGFCALLPRMSRLRHPYSQLAERHSKNASRTGHEKERMRVPRSVEHHEGLNLAMLLRRC